MYLVRFSFPNSENETQFSTHILQVDIAMGRKPSLGAGNNGAASRHVGRRHCDGGRAVSEGVGVSFIEVH